MMDKTIGNFLTQANRDFPLDCETLDYLQTLPAVAEIIGNIAGDKVILFGCKSSNGGAHREDGYVFVRTQVHPEGEVLYWEGGSTSGGMYIRLEDVSVNANNISYSKAYTKRSLAPGLGLENYKWEDFIEIKTIRELMNENRSLRDNVEQMQQAPLGVIQIWAGSKVPEGYLLCDGTAYKREDYPELYEALGTTFNTAVSAAGSNYSTSAGYFRVPDLRGRFITGRHDSDNDYRTLGQGGGVKSVQLKEEHLPAHKHLFKDYTMIPNGSGECSTGNWNVGGENCNVGADRISGNPKRAQTSGNNKDTIQYIKHNTESAGTGSTLENRPPYYVLAYIMRCK